MGRSINMECPHCNGRGWAYGSTPEETGEDTYQDSISEYLCSVCNGTGEIDCFRCKGSGKVTCPTCKGHKTFPCHLKSPHYANRCEMECLSDDRVVLSKKGIEVTFDRPADRLVNKYLEAIKEKGKISLHEYSLCINEKILNEEFNDLFGYINLEIQGKEREFTDNQKSICYDFYEISHYAHYGQIFNST